MDEKELKEAIAGLMKDKSQKDALAQLLVEYIQPNHITTDFISMLMPSRQLAKGDVLLKKVRTGITVHSHVPGSIPLKSEVTVRDRMTWVLDTAIVGVNCNLWELDSGEIGTVESLRTESMAKLRDYYMNKVYTALTTVWTTANTPHNYTSVGGALTATALEDAINYINQTTSGAKVIVGVRSALTSITHFGAYWPSAQGGSTTFPVPSAIEEVMRTGWLGQYMGVPVLALNQVWDNPADHNALLPTNKILVIGENVGEFITYGPERYKEWVNNEPTPPYWNMDIMSQFGMIIDKAEGIYVVGGLS
jgi:hypothetical protein